ncbi:MAG: glycoside hydrolase family 2 TIM barrel-domain containing protein [Bacteroidales bacterium]
MLGKKISLLCLFLVVAFSTIHARISEKINDSWRFVLGDFADAKNVNYSDRSWRLLNLPHDWAFENGFSKEGAQSDKGGYASGGIGWYRKTLRFSEKELDQQVIYIDFDAVYMNSDVWINGIHLGKRPYGYVSFRYDLTPHLKAGDNVIAVRVDNSLEPSARWYHGCGIYGNVHLTKVNPVHFEQWGHQVTTSLTADSQAEVRVTSRIAGEPAANTTIEYALYNAKGKRVALAKTDGRTPSALLPVTAPQLWSVESPYLYTLQIKLYEAGKLVDNESLRVGVRQIEWNEHTGFWMNGKNIKLNGVCEHLEGGPIGAAWTEKMMRWKLSLLKEMGCNAIRTAHNPQLPVFYDLCDEMGLMVMDEAFDGWQRKADHDYGRYAFPEWWERDLRAMIRRDRNHPSVVIYSIGNETDGKIGKELVRVCHEEDSTRLVTSGTASTHFMDIRGINGDSEKQSFFKNYKSDGRPFIGTETPHTWQVRGFYRTQTWYRDGFPNKNQDPFTIKNLTPKEIFGYDWTSPENKANAKQQFNSSYDNATVRITARHNIAFLRDLPWYSGHFRWTGFDYLGEAGYVHGGWPFRAFMGGVIDLAGFEKDHYFLYQSQWRKEKDMVHVLPHWTHPDMTEGTLIPVWAYTTGDEAELFLNGKSYGRRQNGEKWDQMQCEWMVPWTPGQIEVVAYRNNREIARTKHITAQAPALIALETNTRKLRPDATDMAIVTLRMQDAMGNFHPFGENRIFIHLSDNGFIQSLESGNPVDTDTNWNAASMRPFYGLLRAFVTSGQPGDVMLTAGAICGDKSLMQSDTVSIDVKQIALRGKNKSAKFKIYYSVNGNKPNMEYTRPFKVTPGTEVKAAVYDENGRQLLDMKESFGDGSGIYWGTPGGETEESVNRHQAENAKLTGASIQAEGALKYVNVAPQGSIEWYQENDGDEYKTILNLLSKGTTATTGLELWVNGVPANFLAQPVMSGNGWLKQRSEVKIQRGANILILKNTSEKDLLVDWIEFEK